MASRGQRGKDVRPEIVGGLQRAIKIMAESGKPLSSIWVKMFDDDPFQAMKIAIATLPKEIEMDVQAAIVDSTAINPDLLRQVFQMRRDESATDDKPVH